MTQLTPQIISAPYSSTGATGLTPAYTAASAGGDSMAAGPTTFLHVKNASGATPTTVTLAVQAQQEGHPEQNETLLVPITSERMIGPLPARIYGDANGNVQLTYSSVASVTVAALVLAA